MTQRSISVILRAQVDDFTREMSKASKSLDELVKREDKHGTVATTTAGKIVQSARLQSDAWSTAGQAMLGAGLAITGINVAVAKTGIEYNTLQQSSRAALSAILGGAKQANAQMDQLDAFARTSPFAKDVFIRAQQQMLGFGIEARKVVPYLSAINEAVAATGGSNQDIAELTRIFSQIQAASKITATDLMQFGQRGVDAASLIGSQMGKTGAQIREDITAGTLDAGVALDALAAGMTQRFEGASAGVKNTMTGAFDRVKAAWRDLSSAIMEPAVGKGGGGFLVDATNSVADFLRLVEKLPAPVRDTAFILSGLAGAGLTVAGSFALGLPRILETVTAFRDLGATFPAVASGMRMVGTVGATSLGILGVVLAGAAVATGHLASEQAKAQANADGFTAAMQGQSDALNANVRAVAAKQLADAGALDAARTLGLSLQLVTDAALGSAPALDQVNRAMQAKTDAARDAYAASAQSAGGARDEQRAYLDTLAATSSLRGALGETSAAYQSARDAAEATGEAVGGTAGELERQAAAAQESAAAIQQLANAQLALSGSAIGVQQAIADANGELEKHGQNLDITTEGGRKNRSSLDGIAASALKMAESQRNANVAASEVDAAMARNRASFIETAKRMGMNADEAALLADAYGLIPGSVTTAVSAPGATASTEQVNDLHRRIQSLPAEKRAIVTGIFQTSGYEAALRAYESIRPKTVPIVASFSTSGYAATASRAGGRIAGLAYGGPLPGHAPHDRADNVIFAGTPGEWVIQKPTTRYYGDSIMADFNAGRFSRQDLMRLQGLAYGGEVQSWRAHQQSMVPARSIPAYTQPTAAPVLAGPIDLSPASVQAVAAAMVAGADGIARAHVGNNARALAAARGAWG